MGIGRDRLLQFERDLLNGKNICSSRGIFVTFPSPLQAPFRMKGLGVIVCGQGEFLFLLNQKKHLAKAGESLFLKMVNFRSSKNLGIWKYRCCFIR